MAPTIEGMLLECQRNNETLQGQYVGLILNAYSRAGISLHHTLPHCTTLHHTAPHCTTLRHTAPHCTTLHHTAPHCTTLHHTATHKFPSKNDTRQGRYFVLILGAYSRAGITLQHTAPTAPHCTIQHHTAPHCTTPHCNTLQHSNVKGRAKSCSVHCNALQRTATHCNTLQHTATHCNTLQHTARSCKALERAARQLAHCKTRLRQTCDQDKGVTKRKTCRHHQKDVSPSFRSYCLCMFLCMYVCICVYMYVHTCVCVNVYTYLSY